MELNNYAELREQFLYKHGTIEVCFKSLTPIEQYELMRLILAFPDKKVSICTHEATSSYVDEILKLLPIRFYTCFNNPTLLKDIS
jgi:hypothetical protein